MGLTSSTDAGDGTSNQQPTPMTQSQRASALIEKPAKRSSITGAITRRLSLTMRRTSTTGTTTASSAATTATTTSNSNTVASANQTPNRVSTKQQAPASASSTATITSNGSASNTKPRTTTTTTASSTSTATPQKATSPVNKPTAAAATAIPKTSSNSSTSTKSSMSLPVRMPAAPSISKKEEKAMATEKDEDISDWWPKKGEYIEARCFDWKRFYGGEIKKVMGKGAATYYDVLFDDGKRIKPVQRSEIRRPRKNKNGGVSDQQLRRERLKSTAAKNAVLSGSFSVGDRVAAKIPGWEKYYDGVIVMFHHDGTYEVEFDDGEKVKSISPEEMIPINDEAEDEDDLEDDEFEEGFDRDDDDNDNDDNNNKNGENGKGKEEKVEAVKSSTITTAATVTATKTTVQTPASPTLKKSESDHDINEVSIFEAAMPSKMQMNPHFPSRRESRRESRRTSSAILPSWLKPGARVEVKLPGWHKWYAASVDTVDVMGLSKVTLDDGEVRIGILPSQLRMEQRVTFSENMNDGKDEGNTNDRNASKPKPGVATSPRKIGSTASTASNLSTSSSASNAADKASVNGDSSAKSQGRSTLTKIGEDETLKEGDIPELGADVYTIGMRVEAKCGNMKAFTEGRIEKVNADGSYVIVFDDGAKVNNVSLGQMRPSETARKELVLPKRRFSLNSASKGTLKVGDYVEAQVTGWRKAYPGTIEKVHPDGTYQVLFEDGEKVHHVKASEIREQNRYRAGSDESEYTEAINAESQVFKNGERVAARLFGWRKFWPGYVIAVRNGTYDIQFDDGERYHKIEPSCMKKVSADSVFVAEKLKEPGEEKFDVGERITARLPGWQWAARGVIEKDNGEYTYIFLY